MPIHLSWYDKTETVLLYQFKGHWNWEDFRKQMKVGREWMASKPHTIHFIIDFSENRQLMTGLLQEAQHMLATAPANAGKMVIINANHFLQLIYAVLKQIEYRFPQKLDVEFAHSIPVAYERLLAEKTG